MRQLRLHSTEALAINPSVSIISRNFPPSHRSSVVLGADVRKNGENRFDEVLRLIPDTFHLLVGDWGVPGFSGHDGRDSATRSEPWCREDAGERFRLLIAAYKRAKIFVDAVNLIV